MLDEDDEARNSGWRDVQVGVAFREVRIVGKLATGVPLWRGEGIGMLRRMMEGR